MKFIAPRGTKDILPEEACNWNKIEEISRTLFMIYGYEEIRTPIFEELALFARSLGETSDVVQKQMLNLEKEGLALRPEGTASVVRAYLEHSIDKKQSNLAKLFYIGPMFRGERPQKGRLRQFHQIGVEVLGPDSSSPYLDAEVIALSIHLLNTFGLKDFKLKINSLGDKQDKINLSAWLRENLQKKRKDLCGDCQERFERNILRVLDCRNLACQEIIKDLKGFGLSNPKSKEYFKNVQEALKDIGVSFEVDPFLVRGLDYYTQVVFEISSESESLGSQNALGAGGRYNTLIQDLGGGEKLGGLGFALGVERILLALKENPVIKEKSLLYYFVALDEDSLKVIFKRMNDLRQVMSKKGPINKNLLSGYKISPIKNQMSLANKINARFVVIVGENERKEGVVTIKDMETRNQQKKSWKEFEDMFTLQLMQERA